MKVDDLIKKYPKMFPVDENGKFTHLLGFGFEDVWLKHLDTLMSCIQNYIDNNDHLKVSQVRVHQIKEKFGGLRFYFDGGDETIRGMIWLAEYQSQFLCERCYKPGILKENKRGWYLTLCKSHWKKEDEK